MKINLFTNTIMFFTFFYTSTYGYQLNKTDIEVLKKSKRWLNSEYASKINNNGTIHFKYGKAMPTVFCKPYNATSIELEVGEVVQTFKSGDSERWSVDTVVRKNNLLTSTTYVLVKPSVSNLETNFLIYTNKRIYNIRLVSKETLWTPFVAFTYGGEVIDKSHETLKKKKTIVEKKILKKSLYSIKVDSLWKPSDIYNKHGKTYIKTKPKDYLKLFVMNKNTSKTITYQYKNGFLIVDAIIEKAILVKDGFFKKVIKIRKN